MAGPKQTPAAWSLATLKGEALTVGAGACGGLLFTLMHIPGGAMSGSVIAVALLSAFAAARVLGPRVGRAIVGLSALALAGCGVYQVWHGATMVRRLW